VIDNERVILYIYSLHEERYRGFINLKEILGIEPSSSHNLDNYSHDYFFSKNHAKGSFLFFYKDTLYLFSQMTAH